MIARPVEPHDLRLLQSHPQSQLLDAPDEQFHPDFGQGRYFGPDPSPGHDQCVVRVADDVKARGQGAPQHPIIPEIPQERTKHRPL